MFLRSWWWREGWSIKTLMVARRVEARRVVLERVGGGIFLRN